MAPGADLSLRERKKLRTRNDLAQAALRLCAERGFDHVTIEEIAAAVEVSPSTLLRYFDRKEDVLLADDGRRLDEFAHRLAARPADEPILDSVRHALVTLADELEGDRDSMLAKSRIMAVSPSVRARSLELYASGEQAVTRLVAARMGTELDDLGVQLIAATSMAALRVAVHVWFADDARQPLVSYLAQTLDLLGGGLNAAFRSELADQGS
jgi:AcrR family transcriptional regulator